MIVVRRLREGIVAHFPIRFSEWLMLFPAVAMGIALRFQQDMFSLTPSFAAVARWGDETFWAVLLLGCGAMRLLALVVNGTFAGFRWSPHLRALASVAGALTWAQFAVGILSAAVFEGGTWSGVVMYSTMLLAEIVNLARASGDIQAGRGVDREHR
ncbi:hypothetical protein CDV50_18765 [Haematobacter massiliensis]|uniref:hypothetical protein n=1 Tax=Haematobacter massiliensis TaxID=195105 RepID=UPI000B49DD8B|nr:hypothetical protein [Haematobacter massiliensis]OWJ69298.1 hypothetical protein CDV50_18765 [Haematobacter massiliensis]